VATEAQLVTETGECPGKVLFLAQGGYLGHGWKSGATTST
jgi:hypothetical protein